MSHSCAMRIALSTESCFSAQLRLDPALTQLLCSDLACSCSAPRATLRLHPSCKSAPKTFDESETSPQLSREIGGGDLLASAGILPRPQRREITAPLAL